MQIILILVLAGLLGGVMFMAYALYRLFYIFAGKRKLKTPEQVRIETMRYELGARKADIPLILRLISERLLPPPLPQPIPIDAAAPPSAALIDTPAEAANKAAASETEANPEEKVLQSTAKNDADELLPDWMQGPPPQPKQKQKRKPATINPEFDALFDAPDAEGEPGGIELVEFAPKPRPDTDGGQLSLKEVTTGAGVKT